MVAAGESLDKSGRVVPSLHGKSLQRKGSHLQAGNPAFGAGFQCGDLFGREIQAHRPIKKSGRFVRSKTKIGGPQLGQLAPDA